MIKIYKTQNSKAIPFNSFSLIKIFILLGTIGSTVNAWSEDFGWTLSGGVYRSDSGLMNYSSTPNGMSQNVNVYKSIPTKNMSSTLKQLDSSYSFSKSGITIIKNGDLTIQHGYIILPMVKKDIESSRIGHLTVTDQSNSDWIFDANLNKLREVSGCELTAKGKHNLPELESCQNKLVVDLGEGRTTEKLSTLVSVRSSNSSCRVPLSALLHNIPNEKNPKDKEVALTNKDLGSIKSALIKANSSCANLFTKNSSSKTNSEKNYNQNGNSRQNTR